MVEPINVSYEEFPENPVLRDGMITIAREEYSPIILSEYIYDEKENLRFIYLNTQKKAPFIFYVQGSAWMKQKLYEHVPELYTFAKKWGFNIAIAEYRDTSRAPFPAQVEDSKKALYYISQHADELNVDIDNILLWGDSSGAHTVMMMAVTHNTLFQDFTLPEIKGVVDFFGPSHIATMNDYPSTMDHVSPETPEGRLIGFKNVLENPDLADKTIVMNYIDKDKPLVPVAIFHGTKDRLVPFTQSVELYDKLIECGKDVVFYRLERADHGGEYFWHEKTLDLVHDFAVRVLDI